MTNFLTRQSILNTITERATPEIDIYDKLYKYVDDDNIDIDLKCPICIQVLHNPVFHIECKAMFCSTCYLQCNKKCPICRRINPSIFTVPNIINTMLSKLNI